MLRLKRGERVAFRERVHVNLVSALRTAAVNPARVIGAENRRDAARPGFDADLNLLRDNLSVAFTMVRGGC